MPFVELIPVLVLLPQQDLSDFLRRVGVAPTWTDGVVRPTTASASDFVPAEIVATEDVPANNDVPTGSDDDYEGWEAGEYVYSRALWPENDIYRSVRESHSKLKDFLRYLSEHVGETCLMAHITATIGITSAELRAPL